MKKLMSLFICGIVGSVFAASEPFQDVVDVLLAFDASAVRELKAAGYAKCEDFAEQKIQEMNVCLANSGLADDFSFRLVGTTELTHDTSSATLMDILLNVQGKAAEFAPVHALRDTAGADLISVISGGEKVDGANGLGYTLVPDGRVTDAWIDDMADYGINVCRLQALLQPDDYSLLHEFAHNMGCGHAEGIDEPETALGFADYSKGSYFVGETGTWVTIMGYPNKKHAWIPYFSSPSVLYDGVPTGSETCDNVRTLRENHAIVARYRTSVKAPDGVEIFDPKGAALWQGAIYKDKSLVALVQAKIGRAAKGISKVTLTVIDVYGKKFTSSAVKVPTGAAKPQDFSVKKYGSVTLTLGASGFSGTTADGAEIVSVEARPPEGPARLVFEADPTFVVAGLQADYFPDEEVLRSGKKWTIPRKAGKLKAVKPNPKKGLEGGIVKSGEGNFAGLKVSFDAKKMTFKGSFKVWTYDPVKYKLKALSVSFTGLVAEDESFGVAVLKKVPVGVVTIQ